MVFGGQGRGKLGQRVEEAPSVMTVPMVILAILTVLGGFVHTHWTGTRLGDWLVTGPAPTYGLSVHSETWIMLLALLVSLAGIWVAYQLYVSRTEAPQSLANRFSGLYRLLYNKYYVDESYQVSLVSGLKGLSAVLAWLDRCVIEGLVRFAAWLALAVGRLSASWQNGQVQCYGLTVFVGLVVIILAYVFSGGVVQ